MMTRRRLITSAAAISASCGHQPRQPLPRARVAVLRASSYSTDFEKLIVEGLAICRIAVRGKRVLVKPNLVEYVAGVPVHTNASVLAGCIAALESLGAQVIVGEGPGHRRDTIDMAQIAGYKEALPLFSSRFHDLNIGNVRRVDAFAGGDPIYLPETVLGADLIVSLAKLKTHHWAGATLSMKNLFGIVPGAIYGWPKNHLHFTGVHTAVSALYNLLPRTIGIVDGVVGMQGNGPIQGRPVPSRLLVVGSDTAAVDATCCRMMGIDPRRIDYLSLVNGRRTWLDQIEQRAETPDSERIDFELPPRMSHLRAEHA
jgi:uncharacterized protein (DUF362 family)